MPTPWTAETLWPAQGEQIVAASLLARKVRLEFELVARVILHQALHYILGSPESSGYPAYEVLQVSPNADLDTIQRVYRLLAQRYHPDNAESGNEEAFRLVLSAFRVLIDPEKRAAYDAKHKSQRSLRWRIFTQTSEAMGVDEEKRTRVGILSALYAMRRTQPTKGGMLVRELESLLGCPSEHLEFSFWYLQGKGLVERTDGGRYTITPAGVDLL